MKYLFFLILFTLAISGCEQYNKRAEQDCIIEASKAQTREGVVFGIQACHEKYEK